MVKLYLDEDVNILLSALLRAPNINATTTLESDMLGASDEEQLDFALSIGAAVVTHNRIDFEALFRHYLQKQRETSGIVILIRRDVHEMARRLSGFCFAHESARNQLFYV